MSWSHLSCLLVIQLIIFSVSIGIASPLMPKDLRSAEEVDAAMAGLKDNDYEPLSEMIKLVPLDSPKAFSGLDNAPPRGLDKTLLDNCVEEIKPHLWSLTKEITAKKDRDLFGNLPAFKTRIMADNGQELHVIGISLPSSYTSKKEIDRRVESAHKRLFQWLLFYDTALRHRLQRKGIRRSTNEDLIKWVKHQLYTPFDSQPVTGKIKDCENLQHTEHAFGEIQKMTIKCLGGKLRARADDEIFQKTACNLIGIWYTQAHSPPIFSLSNQDQFWSEISSAGKEYEREKKYEAITLKSTT